jgi:hypothetical protein
MNNVGQVIMILLLILLYLRVDLWYVLFSEPHLILGKTFIRAKLADHVLSLDRENLN